MATQTQQKKFTTFRGTDLLGNGVDQKTLEEFGFRFGAPVKINLAPNWIHIGAVLNNDFPIVPISSAQSKLLRQLLIEKVISESEREVRISGIPELTKREASIQINALINHNA